MNKYNEIEFNPEVWAWYGIEDDIMTAWCNRFGEENVSSCLNGLREYLKTRPDFERTNIEKYYGGNWAFWIWNCLKRNEQWRLEKENEQEIN